MLFTNLLFHLARFRFYKISIYSERNLINCTSKYVLGGGATLVPFFGTISVAENKPVSNLFSQQHSRLSRHITFTGVQRILLISLSMQGALNSTPKIDFVSSIHYSPSNLALAHRGIYGELKYGKPRSNKMYSYIREKVFTVETGNSLARFFPFVFVSNSRRKIYYSYMYCSVSAKERKKKEREKKKRVLHYNQHLFTKRT